MIDAFNDFNDSFSEAVGKNSIVVSIGSRSYCLSFVGVFITYCKAREGDIALAMSFSLRSCWSSFVGVFSIGGQTGDIITEVSLDVGTENTSPSEGRFGALVIRLIMQYMDTIIWSVYYSI